MATDLERLRALRETQLRFGLIKAPKPGEARVVVFSTPTCPYCHMAKDYLQKRGISFNDVNVAADGEAARALMRQTGQTGVPQLNINGQWILGFDREAIDRALGL